MRTSRVRRPWMVRAAVGVIVTGGISPSAGEVLDAFEALLELRRRQRRAFLIERNARAFREQGHGGDADIVVAAAHLVGRRRRPCPWRSPPASMALISGRPCRRPRPRSASTPFGLIGANDAHVGFRKPDHRDDLDPARCRCRWLRAASWAGRRRHPRARPSRACSAAPASIAPIARCRAKDSQPRKS